MASKCEGCGELGVYFGKLCADCLREAHDEYLQELGFLKRLQLSREAILKIRSKLKIKTPLSTLLSDKGLWGCVGLLDYIKTGDLEKILEPTVRRQVEKINAETWKKKAEKTLG